MPSDRLYRAMRFITPHGLVVVDVTSSRTASTIAHYSEAVHRYLETGDSSMLIAYEGKMLRVGQRTYPFVTDRHVLERLGHAGEVSFEDLYARTSGEPASA